MRIGKKLILSLLFGALFFGWLPAEAKAAARFYIEPATGSYNNNGEFAVSVWVDPSGKDVQAMDIIINFDKTRLEADKNKIVDEGYFDYGSSVFNVDNTTGQMKLYVFSSQGSYSKNTKEKVVSITFRTKAEGLAALNFVCGDAAGSSAIRNINEDNFIDCSANGSGSYTISAGGSSNPAPTSVPTAVPTSAGSPLPTATPAELPKTGFSLVGWSIISLGGALLGTGLAALLL